MTHDNNVAEEAAPQAQTTQWTSQLVQQQHPGQQARTGRQLSVEETKRQQAQSQQWGL